MIKPTSRALYTSQSTVGSLVSRINAQATQSKDLEHDQSTRANLLQLSRELTASLQAPDEVCSLLAFSIGPFMCVRVADELKIFDLLCEKSPRSTQELASITGAEHGLIVRVMRVLGGMGFAFQQSKNIYSATAVSKQMTLPSVRAGIKTFHTEGFPAVHRSIDYFKENGWRLPRAMNDNPYNFAEGTTENPFTHMSKKPGVMETFNVFMQGLFGTPFRLGWSDWFPIKEVALDGFDETQGNGVCFVDVGAGKGHEGNLVLQKYPETKGKFIAQDLEFVISDIQKGELDHRIETMVHDFTKPQPVKGARVYFLQNILHDWASPVCHEILTSLREAMTPGYSKLIVCNIILPEGNVPLRQSCLDVAMLYMHSGQQRTQEEFRELFETAGLKVTKFWLPPGDGDGIVEAEVA
ncbi:S-adenosyl-L-methionine-dependent methyltransferase [Polychaeton citri CBS 116435]|uniref:S-adenosyl-L-methionine-dependent methyltransferase n=1 Tax=Polychaeton citri CBS 116435 TaxID=1314669 RepID=A0A9P4UUX8_9PEZI|nr:S-adenosyl-L-methionine-dependent methyltransferase [Polychaeton citri CBS 116435]